MEVLKMQGKSCFFIGHRDASDALRPQLDQTIERCITEHGVVFGVSI